MYHHHHLHHHHHLPSFSMVFGFFSLGRDKLIDGPDRRNEKVLDEKMLDKKDKKMLNKKMPYKKMLDGKMPDEIRRRDSVEARG